MSFRFWRRIKIAPGLTLNLSKSGGSLSLGPRGAKYTIGPRGRRTTVGIPGTGLFYTKKLDKRRSKRGGSRRSRPAEPTVSPQDRLTLGFFKRLITPNDEEALVDGCRELLIGHEDQAITHLRKATHLADGAFLAGYTAMKKGKLTEATRHLNTALLNHQRLDRYLSKYEIVITVTLHITEEIVVHVGPSLRGVLLLLVELYQSQKKRQKAINCLQRLRRLEPEDVIVKLSLAELLLDGRATDQNAPRQVVRLAEDVENQTAVHTALLLYKARALRALGLNEAARTVLTAALRRKKGRSKGLMHALRYERALAYEALGQGRRARSDLEKIYAEDADFEDIEARLHVN